MREILIQRKKKNFLTLTQLLKLAFLLMIWFVDECGFNIWLRRSYGRSRKGERAYRTAHGQRGKNVSLCLAISSSHIVHHKIIGAYDRIKFQEFIFEIDALSQERMQLIMENCRIHYQVDLTNHQLKFLSPYSPFLNPIEAFFSKLKNHIRGQLRAVDFENMQQTERSYALKQKVVGAIHHFWNCNNHPLYRHSASFYSICLQKNNILGD